MYQGFVLTEGANLCLAGLIRVILRPGKCVSPGFPFFKSFSKTITAVP